MDFFGKQDQALENTWKLLLSLFVSVLIITTVLYLVLSELFSNLNQINKDLITELGPLNDGMLGMTSQTIEFLQPLYDGYPMDLELFLLVFGMVCGLILIGSWWKFHQLSHGGKVIAEALGGKLVSPDSQDETEIKLLNVVEEMSIAAGMPVPPVYIMGDEPGINAFAAGYDSRDLVIAVTQGTLNYLKRDELQAVIAHEYSHLIYGDTALNMRITGWLVGLFLLAQVGTLLTLPVRLLAMTMTTPANNAGDYRTTHHQGFHFPPHIIIPSLLVLPFGLVIQFFGTIGAFMGDAIKAAISREREFLADAAAVQFTRNPEAIVRAFKKIGGFHKGSSINSPRKDEASHIFFGSVNRTNLIEIFATHPPIEERIVAIDPHWQGDFIDPTLQHLPDNSDLLSEIGDELNTTGKPIGSTDSDNSFLSTNNSPELIGAATSLGVLGVTASSTAPPLQNQQQSEAFWEASTIRSEHLYFARAVRESITPPLRQVSHEPFGAQAVIYALLLHPHEMFRNIQLKHLQQGIDAGLYTELRRIIPMIEELPERSRIPLVDLTIPALRMLSSNQYQIFRTNIRGLVESDMHLDLFEFALQRILLRHLDAHFNLLTPPSPKFTSLQTVLPQVHTLLSSMARFGSPDSEEVAQAAYTFGLQHLQDTHPERTLEEVAAIEVLEGALDQLELTSNEIKKQVIWCCACVAAHDGHLTSNESELLRAVADSLDVPIPPFIHGEDTP